MLQRFRNRKEKREEQQKNDTVPKDRWLIKKIAIIMLLTTLIIIATIIGLKEKGKIINEKAQNHDPEIIRSMTYEKVAEGENATNSEYVKFDVFFLRDLEGNGYAQGIRGSCRNIGDSDTIYMELKVQDEGYLEDGVITINGENIYLQTTLPKDNEIKENVIGNNVKEIKLNTIHNGSQKLLMGVVRSGNYNYSSSKTEAIGNNINKYSSKNSITLSGTHVDDNGNRKTVTKTVEFDMDWHGTVKAEMPTYIYGNRNLYQEQNIENAINEEENTFTIEHNIGMQEIKNELNIKKAYIETEIPSLNGYEPIKVEAINENVTYTYDEETKKLTCQKEAIIDENGMITTQANDGTYLSNRYNIFKIKVTYPLEAYYSVGLDTIQVNMQVKGYYEGFNNTNEEFINPYKSNEVNNNFILTMKRPQGDIENGVARFDIKVGEHVYIPRERYIVSKAKPISVYNGNSEPQEDDTYVVSWFATTGPSSSGRGMIMKETEDEQTQVSDQFVEISGNNISMEDITSNIGIYFSGLTNVLGEEGWIKVYDVETDELITTFNNTNWNKYNKYNPYIYDIPIKHIRIETSNVNINSSMCIYNVKRLDNEYITENYTKEEFDELQCIKSTLAGYLGTEHINTDIYSANYESPYTALNVKPSKTSFSTQKTEKNLELTIGAIADERINQEKWLNGVFLVKLPLGIIDININNVNANNDVKILSYEQFQENEVNYIKINTENEIPTTFDLTINYDITPDPRMVSSVEYLEVYAYNENGTEYWNKVEDRLDINDNLNTSEFIGETNILISLISPNSLLTNQTISNYDEDKNIIIAPKIAEITKKQHTADINIELTNNYSSTISEVMILGRIPFEGNKYVINGRELDSKFTSNIQGDIIVPDELKEDAIIYYSENGEANRDLKDYNNGWTTTPNDFSKVKSYLIDISNHIFETGEKSKFTYTVNIPEEVEYNKSTYSHYAIYFALDTTEGKYRTQTEPNKIGFTIAQKYDLEIKKYQKNKNKIIPGATYKITEEGKEESKTKVTDIDGKFILNNIYIDKVYTIKEIKSPVEYELNNNEIKFKAIEENSKIKIQIISGTTREIIEDETQNKNIPKIVISVEDECKFNLRILKKEKGTENKIPRVTFRISGDGFSEKGRILFTNKNGEIKLDGLKVGKEYTLEELKVEGYYLAKPIKFITTNNNGIYSINITEGQVKSNEVTEINDIPTVNLIIENEKIPTYNLKINKVSKGENIPLAGAKFRLFKGKEKINDYTTDENGIIIINDLYRYIESREIDQTYTLKELIPPEGYSAIKDITFKGEELEGTLKIDVIEGKIKEQRVDRNTATIVIEDNPIFKLIKKDGETGKVLPNTKFAIYNVNGESEQFASDNKSNILGKKEIINEKEYYILTTDEKGEIEANLKPGLYKAIEIKAVDEKYDITENVYYFEIGETKENQEVVGTTFSKVIVETLNTVRETLDGGIIVGGILGPGSEFDVDGIEEHKLIGNGADGIVIKYNADKEVEWAKTIGGSGREDIKSIVETVDEGIVAGGTFYSDIINIEGNEAYKMTNNSNKGRADGMLIKYNTEGKVEWTNVIGGSNYDYIDSIVATSDGGIVVVGSFESEIINLDKNGEHKLLNKNYSTSRRNVVGMIIKYNIKGDVEWAQAIGGGMAESYAYGDCLNTVKETLDGGIIVGGHFQANIIDIDGSEAHKMTNKGEADGMIIKYNKDGKVEWVKTVGGENFDSIESIAVTSNGEIIVAGYFVSEIIDIDGNEEHKIINHGQKDGMIIKYNKDGKVEWTKTIGGDKDEYIKSIIAKDEEIIVAGYFKSEIIDTDGNEAHKMTNKGEANGMIIKYNKDGKVEWTKAIGGNNRDFVSSVTETLDGGIVIVGSFYSNVIDIDRTGGQKLIRESQYGSNGMLIELGKKELVNPLTVNAAKIGEANNEYITSIKSTSDGGMVVGGYFDSDIINIDGNEEHKIVNHGQKDGMIIKYDKERKIEWISRVGGENNECINEVIPTKDEGIVAVGYFTSEIIDIDGNEAHKMTNKGEADGMIIKYNKDGKVEWTKAIGGNNRDFVSSVTETLDGGIVVGGYFESNVIDIDGNEEHKLARKGGSNDGMIIKYNEKGEVEWANVIGGSNNDYIRSISSTTDGGIVVVGEHNSRILNIDEENEVNQNDKFDGIVIKYNQNGKVEWIRKIAGNNDDYINSVTSILDGGIVVGAYSKTKELGSFNDERIKNKGGVDGIIQKYDIEGKTEWIIVIGGSKDDLIKSISSTKDGGVIVGGIFKSPEIQVGSYKLKNDSETSYMLIKISETGEIQWAKSIEKAGNESDISITELSNKSIIVGGYSDSDIIKSDGKTLINSGKTDGIIFEIVTDIRLPETEELIVKNNRKEFKITTDIKEIDNIKGGSISGEGSNPYEQVKYGDSSTKDIIMSPDKDYEIIKITVNGKEQQFIANSDGTYKMPRFSNMKENKHIVVTYALKQNKITINKVDNNSEKPIEGVKFKLNQIEERTSPKIENLIGNSNTYSEMILKNEITGVLGQLTNSGNSGYYFKKLENGTYVPTNSNKYDTTSAKNNTTASSYIPIDLTGRTGTYAVVVNAYVSSEANYDWGYATISNSNTVIPNYSTESGRFIYTSGNVNSRDYQSMNLTGGNVYYLHLGYRKDGSQDTGEDQIVINNIKVYEIEEGTVTYNFKEENGVYKSTNQGKANTTSNSYIIVDLNGYTGKYDLTLKARVSSQKYNDYGYVTITTNSTAPQYNNSTGRLVYISGTTENDYTTVLEGGTKYYIHLGYYKNASGDSGDDTFTVSNIRVEPNNLNLYNTEVETNDKGQAITQIPFGKYSLTEVKTPDEYIQKTEPIEIEFRENGTHEFTVKNQKKSQIIVHHYLKDKNGNITNPLIKIKEDEKLLGIPGDEYITLPLVDINDYELEKNNAGEYIIPPNAKGNFKEDDDEIFYYYVEKKLPITVHHYIENTNIPVPLAEGINFGDLVEDGYTYEENGYKSSGYKGENYITKSIPDEKLSKDYEIAQIPFNYKGIYSNGEVIVTYFYKKVERKVNIEKYDKNNRTPLLGAKFTITKIGTSDNQIEEPIIYTTNEKGKLSVILEAGEYEITEIEAPQGYQIPENQTTRLAITKETTEENIEITNDKIKGKIIVHHYIKGTNIPVKIKNEQTNEIENAKSEEKIGYVGETYATKVKEKLANGYIYDSTVGETSGEYTDGIKEITYYYIEIIDLDIIKKWKHTNNIYEKPESVIIEVYANETKINEITLSAKDREIIEDEEEMEETWNQTIKGLPKYDDDRNEIIYTIVEKK